MNKNFTKQEYSKYVKSVSPNSKLFINIIKAFVVGGSICVIGQVIFNWLKGRGLDPEMVSGLTSTIMIFFGAFFTALNIYDELGRFAGAGSIVPITGFANSVVSPAMEFKTEGYIMGTAAKMFVIAGPVIVFGICSSVLVGIIHYFIS
ncbi:stage V sporulation protein AC [Ruminiclostridium cellobioparum]|uniref:stage V sporulation protein AC n=1 Tax=Ruminiclostridium cellobioparum TaxID=29355 RepID=UPI0004838392|nr:stage V sporulation protein AC [Ruminiclostridium cellobioparum]